MVQHLQSNVIHHIKMKDKNQQIILTYPEKVLLPIMNETELQQIIQFRSKGRIP